MAWYRGLNIPLNGLMFFTDFNNVKSYPGSGTTVYDISGNRNNGTLSGGPSYVSGNINSLSFDASNDLLTLSTSTYSEWTISMLLKFNLNGNILASRDLFYNIPAAGAAAEGYFRIADDLFYSVNTSYIDADDNIYGGGQNGGYNSNIRPLIVKITSSGDYETSFNAGLTGTYLNGSAFSVNSIIEYDNHIYIAGTNIGVLSGSIGVAIYNKTNASTSGVTQISGAAGGGTSICSSITLDTVNNALYVVGNWATTYQSTNISGGLVKMALDTKTIDATFNTSTGFNNTEVYRAILDSSQNLYCIGNFTSYKSTSANRIVKINKTDASIDTSFNYGTGFTGGVVNSLVIDSGGKLYIAGAFTNYNGTSINRIIKLNTDGTIDSSFNVGTGFNGQVRSLKIDSNGKIIALGDFTTYRDVSANRIVRINTDGTRDATFDVGTGFNNITTDVSFTSSGKLIVVGSNFTTYNGNTTPASICRLNTDGTYDNTFQPAGFNMPLYRGRIEVRLAGGTIQNSFGGTFGISPGRNVFNTTSGSILWNDYNHIVVTFSSDKNFRFYRNGALITTLASTGSANCNMNLNQLFFRDNVYFFQFYNRALPLSEIQSMFNCIRKRINR
jgi:uncharacterized delta-60 repeat protein